METASHNPNRDSFAYEAIIKQFEVAWNSSDRPRIDEFLHRDKSQPIALLLELVHVELEFRLRSGEPARVEEYLLRYPELNDQRILRGLIAAERWHRERNCESPSIVEYAERFPSIREQLTQWLESPQSTRLGLPAGNRPLCVPDIPGYRILSQVGEGGMGVVYKAHQVELNRFVAIKTLTAPDPATLERFRRETQAIAHLDHPHIVSIYEVGDWRPGEGEVGVPYFVMKWYPRGSLADVESKGDYRQIAERIESIARAVQHAHERGILHRDLKPANVLLDDQGEPHVADFGLAGRFDPNVPQTRTETIVGTPSYMAPEQALTPSQVTIAADVYGIGTILYQLLTGKPPFLADGPLATLDLVAKQLPDRPSLSNAGIPRDLEIICLKCLEKQPGHRYPSATALADDLDRWRTGKSILARVTPLWERTYRWAIQHPLATSLGTLTVAAIVFGISALVISNARISKKQTEATAARDELAKALDRERRQLYSERIASANRLFLSNQLESAWAILDLCPPALRGWEWYFLDRHRHLRPTSIDRHSTTVTGIGFLADGRLASADASGLLRVEDRSFQAAGEVMELSVHPTRPLVALALPKSIEIWDVERGYRIQQLTGGGWVAFSPTGSRIAGGRDRARLWEVESWQLIHEGPKSSAELLAGTFSPQGTQLVTSSSDRVIRRWDAGSGREIAPAWTRTAFVGGMAYSSNGKVLIEGHPNAVSFVDSEKGTSVRPALDTLRRPRFAAFPNENAVAIAGPNHELQIVVASTGTLLRTLRGNVNAISTIGVSSDSRKMAVGGLDGSICVWDMSQQQKLDPLAFVGEWAGGFSLSPDGTQIAVAPRPMSDLGNPFVRVYSMPDGKEVVKMLGLGGPAFHPQGRQLVSGHRDGGIVVSDAVTGEPIHTRTIPRVKVNRAEFSPDGRWLFTGEIGGGLRMWDTENWELPTGMLSSSESPVYALHVSPAGSRVAVGRRGSVEVWDYSKRELIASLPSKTAHGVSFDQDGELLAIADRDQVVRIYRTSDWTPVGALNHPGGAESVAFSPDGKRLVSGGNDGALRIWDVELGKQLLMLVSGNRPIAMVRWETRNDRIISLDDVLRVWSK